MHVFQAVVTSSRATEALSTLVVGSDTNIITGNKLDTIEIKGPARAGFLPRQTTPYLTVSSIKTISGSEESLFVVGKNNKVTWGTNELHIREPVHVAEGGTLTLPEVIYIENGGTLDICGTLSSDTGNITMRDGGEMKISNPATTLNVKGFFVDYKGKLSASSRCSGSGKVTIQTTFFNKSDTFTLDTSHFTMDAAEEGELSKPGAALKNTTCKTSGKLELLRNQYCELATGTHNFKSITIHPGAELRLIGDTAGKKKTTINVETVNVMFQGKIAGAGKGYKTGGPGAGSSSGQGASHGGKGHGNTKAPYGNVKQPMAYGSNGQGATNTAKRGGGQVKIDASKSVTIDGEIDVSGQETASGGSVYIIGAELFGFGTIRADGGDSGGGGGRISVQADDTYEFTGTYSAKGGTDSSGNPTSAGINDYFNRRNYFLPFSRFVFMQNEWEAAGS